MTIQFQNKASVGSGTTPKTIRLHVEKNPSGVITLCRSISTASTEIWSRGSGTTIFYTGGNVGIDTSTPTAKLDVNGSIKPGAGTVGSACSPEGSFAYDSAQHKPVYCNQAGVWSLMSGSIAGLAQNNCVWTLLTGTYNTDGNPGDAICPLGKYAAGLHCNWAAGGNADQCRLYCCDP